MKKAIFSLFSFLLVAFWANVCNAQSGIITTIAGSPGVSGYSGDGGPATAAVLGSGDKSLACDAVGNLYICDYGRIRRVNTSGIIVTIAGTGILGYSGDGGPATAAQIFDTEGCGWGGIAFDASGNIFFGDVNRIRKIDPSGTITTVAGNGSWSYNGDGMPATNAALTASGLTVDASGNIFFCDFPNNRVRKIDASGIITTIAPAGNPSFITTDVYGNKYFGEAYYVKKIDASGVVSIVGGTTPGFSGDGGPATAAEINQVYGISTDAAGNIIFADEQSNRVRIINATTGIINTIAGSGAIGTWGYSGDGGPATAAQMASPSYTATDGAGSIYINDKNNDVIRKITFPSLSVKNGDFESLEIFPNPTSANVSITHARGSWYVMNDVLGREVYSALISSDQQTINISNLPSGVYLAQTTGDNGLRKTTRIIKQ
jgi:hypothetical protein